MKNLIILISLIVLSGCAALHDDLKPSDAKTKTTIELCKTYGNYGKYTYNLPNIKNELIRRKAFSKREWKLIEKQSIAVGMSYEALICSWGYPDKINRASYGNQVIYERGKFNSDYIYTKNGIVTAWN